LNKHALKLFSILVLICVTRTAFAEGDPSAEDLKNRGNQAMMELNYADAITAYQASLTKNPSDVALHYNIGRAYQARGEYVQALDALLEFDKSAPADTKAKVPSLVQLIVDVRLHVGEVRVHCSADVPQSAVSIGALARIDGCTVTPKSVRVSLATKSAAVEVRLESDSMQAPTTKITIDGGAPPIEVALAVAPKSSTGLLRILALPENAVISVDGTAKGNSPVEMVVGAGSHAVDVSAEGYQKAHSQVVMDAGGKREVNLSLEKTPPITKRWWFWAGTGVLAAGIITVTAILIIQPERSSSKGTIDPGVIRAPLVTF
jgi:hypothetical protein